jgi:hypothetical protein
VGVICACFCTGACAFACRVLVLQVVYSLPRMFGYETEYGFCVCVLHMCMYVWYVYMCMYVYAYMFVYLHVLTVITSPLDDVPVDPPIASADPHV